MMLNTVTQIDILTRNNTGGDHHNIHPSHTDGLACHCVINMNNFEIKTASSGMSEL